MLLAKLKISIFCVTLLCLLTIYPLSAFAETVGYGEELRGSTTNSAQLFSDVDSSNWAFRFINEMSNRKVLEGYPDNKFRPDRIVTRAEIAKIIVLAAGLQPKKTDTSSFSDIRPSDWYTPFIEAAKNYLTGFRTPDGKLVYNPNAPAVREDITVAIVKLKGIYASRLPDQSIIQAMFSDYDGISENARDYVALAVENKIVSGYPDGTFRAQQTITRAEAAAILWRSFQFGNDSKYIPEDSPKQPSTDPNEKPTGNTNGSDNSEKTGYSVSGVIEDVYGTRFFSGITLNGNNGSFVLSRANVNDGSFVFDKIPNGKYMIKFYYDNYIITSPQFINVDNMNLADVTVKLATKTYTISGIALAPNGSPLTNQQVKLEAPGNLGGYWLPTNVDGSFNLTGIAPGTYKIWIGSNNKGTVTVTDKDIINLLLK
jgi:hypothetical protein